MKLLIKLRHLLGKHESDHPKKYFEIDMASHQHFVKRREKNAQHSQKRRGEKEVYSFPSKKTKTHRYYSTIDPTKTRTLSIQVEYDLKEKNKNETSKLFTEICVQLLIYPLENRKKFEKYSKYFICTVSEYNITV